MITQATGRSNFEAMKREAMETDNQLALDILYSAHAFPERFEAWWKANGKGPHVFTMNGVVP